ncbi:NlpC/P60 family protein [uncultured Robinsoniella sp.]|uniref:C40 family peptidase n=1 Tax=uncultured Robinsoniella sp. TaxID=904190 RepID=UPI00374F74F3
MKWKLLHKAAALALAFSLIIPSTAMAAPQTERNTERTTEVKPQTEPVTEPVTNHPIGAENVTEADVLTEIPVETETELVTETETQTESEEATETDTNKREEESTEPQMEPATEMTQEEIDANLALIEQQQIEEPKEIEKPFGITTIEKVYGLSKRRNLQIYEEKSVKSRTVGELEKNGLCYILEEDEKGWVYIESGDVRGFVKIKNLLTGKKANSYVKKKKAKNLEQADCLVSPLKNKAWTYTKTTAQKTVVKKVYAISKTDGVCIQERKKENSNVIGVLPEGGLCYVLADQDEKWIYVESGYVRGFVQRKNLIKGKNAVELVKMNKEENYEFARELIPMEENKSLYYTLTTVREITASSALRNSMVDFARQFLGNSYVWGGTSLTNGADCSGFVQSIYSEFGYSIPRVAEDQAKFGLQIPVADAAPGDLIFYARNGYVYHVVMYIGDGQDIEAHSSARGIITNSVSYDSAVWAVRIIEDDVIINNGSENESGVQGDTELAREQDYGQHLGNFTLTAYCSCPVCCGVWSGGPTASGAMPVQGRTVAMGGIPFGTRLIINGEIYTVEDRGTPYGHVDIYMSDHQDACVFGRQQADVYLAN